MERIAAHTDLLLIRFNNYKRVDFIDEHQKLISENGYVWVLKSGKIMKQDRIQSLIRSKGLLVLRAPKKAGGDYYFAHMVESFNGEPTLEMLYPKYYHDMINDDSLWSFTSLEGTWFRIDSIVKIPRDKIRCLRLASNDHIAEDVVNTTMTSTMYIYNDEVITTDD